LNKRDGSKTELIDPPSNVTLALPVEKSPWKLRLDIDVMDDGRQSVSSAGQLPNTASPRNARRDWSPKVTADRDEQYAKQESWIDSTDGGMEIDVSASHAQNADSPRMKRTDPGSKVTLERLPQSAKQLSEIRVIDAGIRIASRAMQP
jgi:hypothetical protein